MNSVRIIHIIKSVKYYFLGCTDMATSQRSERHRFSRHVFPDERLTCLVPLAPGVGPQQRQIQRRPLLFAPISETDDRVRLHPRFHRHSDCLRRYRSLLVRCQQVFKRLSQCLVATVSLQ